MMAGAATPAASMPLTTRRRDNFGDLLIVVSPRLRCFRRSPARVRALVRKLGQNRSVVQPRTCDTSVSRAVDGTASVMEGWRKGSRVFSG